MDYLLHIENYIEEKYRLIADIEGPFKQSKEFLNLYSNVENKHLKIIFSILHFNLINAFSDMNKCLPIENKRGYFRAQESRHLSSIIREMFELYDNLKNSQYSFEIDSYYLGICNECLQFLNPRGSYIALSISKIEIYYQIPIFISYDCVHIENKKHFDYFPLKKIGSGSYADVYKYTDTFYNKDFALKRAKKDLSSKEITRFKREYDVMNNLVSPYVLEVYKYDDMKNEYIMEYVDSTLEKYINNHMGLSIQSRKSMVMQIFKAFDYIHSRGILHRDISPQNILIKEYDNVAVVKISDFGLVKIANSNLTDYNTNFKGSYNDPSLVQDGFSNYSIVHEIYALSKVVCFVMIGSANESLITDDRLSSFISKGTNLNKEERFKSVSEMAKVFKDI